MASHQNIHVVRIDLLILGNLYGSEVPSENIWPNEEIHIIKSMTKGGRTLRQVIFRKADNLGYGRHNAGRILRQRAFGTSPRAKASSPPCRTD